MKWVNCKDEWISVIERLPSELTVCEVKTSPSGFQYSPYSLINGIWANPEKLHDEVDMVEFWREVMPEETAIDKLKEVDNG